MSDLCDEHQIQSAQLYQWQKRFFENDASAIEKSGRQKRDFQAERIVALEQNLV